jgi:Ca2+-binding EF-hand superfamily protein
VVFSPLSVTSHLQEPLSFPEWLELLGVICRGTLDDKLDITFRLFDADQDGVLTRAESEQLVTDVGEYLSSDDSESTHRLI